MGSLGALASDAPALRRFSFPSVRGGLFLFLFPLRRAVSPFYFSLYRPQESASSPFLPLSLALWLNSSCLANRRDWLGSEERLFGLSAVSVPWSSSRSLRQYGQWLENNVVRQTTPVEFSISRRALRLRDPARSASLSLRLRHSCFSFFPSRIRCFSFLYLGLGPRKRFTS